MLSTTESRDRQRASDRRRPLNERKRGRERLHLFFSLVVEQKLSLSNRLSLKDGGPARLPADRRQLPEPGAWEIVAGRHGQRKERDRNERERERDREERLCRFFLLLLLLLPAPPTTTTTMARLLFRFLFFLLLSSHSLNLDLDVSVLSLSLSFSQKPKSQDLAKTNLAFVSADDPATAYPFLEVNGW